MHLMRTRLLIRPKRQQKLRGRVTITGAAAWEAEVCRLEWSSKCLLQLPCARKQLAASESLPNPCNAPPRSARIFRGKNRPGVPTYALAACPNAAPNATSASRKFSWRSSEDPRFFKGADKKNHYKTNAMLCIPIIREGSIVAVVHRAVLMTLREG